MTDRFWDLLSEARKEERAAFLAPARYELQACIGEGATSIVYRAFDRELSRVVALKVIKAKILDDFRKRLDREVKVLGKLAHPGIVRLHDVGEHQGRVYLVMECVQGGSLAARLGPPGTPRPDLVPLLEKVAEALQEAHRHGVVHRDLKPENILLTAEGEPKIADFGLAKTLGDDKTVTKMGYVVGTPTYMAPEQIRNEAPSPRTDIYALGTILYRLLAGRLPFDAPGITELFIKVLHEPAVSPVRVNPSVKANFAAVALKALEKHPADRYWSAEAFAQDLAWCRQDRKPAAAQPDPMSVLRKLARRPVLIGGAIALLILVAVGYALQSSNDASVQRLLESVTKLDARGELKEMREIYRSVLTLEPGNARARSEFKRLDALIKREEADLKAAIETIERVSPVIEKATEAFYRSDADFPTHFADVERAREQLEVAMVKVPHHVAGRYYLGRAWFILGWHEKAEAMWQFVLADDAAHRPTNFHLGRLYQIRSYVTHLENGGIASPESQEVSRRQSRKSVEHLKLAARDEETLQAMVAASFVALLEKDEPGALDLAKQGFARFPTQDGREEFLWIRGCVHLNRFLRKEEPAQVADEAFTQAIRIRPWFPLAFFCRALLRPGVGAIADYTEALRAYPRFVEALANRGSELAKLARLDEALVDLEKAVELTPNEWTIANRGSVLQRLGREKEALEDYEKAISLNPADPTAYNFRGLHYASKERWPEALEDFDKARTMGDGTVESYVNRAFVLVHLGRFEEAIADCTIALKARPGFPNALAVRGDSLASLGKFAEALKDFENALRLAPADWPGRDELVEKVRRLKK